MQITEEMIDAYIRSWKRSAYTNEGRELVRKGLEASLQPSFEFEVGEKSEDIAFMLSVIREIYSIAGGDDQVSRLCHKVFNR